MDEADTIRTVPAHSVPATKERPAADVCASLILLVALIAASAAVLAVTVLLGVEVRA